MPPCSFHLLLLQCFHTMLYIRLKSFSLTLPTPLLIFHIIMLTWSKLPYLKAEKKRTIIFWINQGIAYIVCYISLAPEIHKHLILFQSHANRSCKSHSDLPFTKSVRQNLFLMAGELSVTWDSLDYSLILYTVSELVHHIFWFSSCRDCPLCNLLLCYTIIQS